MEKYKKSQNYMPQSKSGGIDAFFTLMIFGLFAVTSILLLVFGSQVYKNVLNRSDISTKQRTVFSYVVNKIRYFDESGKINIETKNGIETLVLKQDFDDLTISTVIYFYDGSLRESMMIGDKELKPEFGEKIIELKDFNFKKDKSLISFEFIFEDGQRKTIAAALRT